MEERRKQGRGTGQEKKEEKIHFNIKQNTDLCHQQPLPPDPCLESYLPPPDQV